MKKILFKNATIIDAKSPSPRLNTNVLINGEYIEHIFMGNHNIKNVTEIDLNGKILMPGLIDAHVHVNAIKMNVANEDIPISECSIQAAKFLEMMLMRGFTSVRDAGGADFGLVNAIRSGLIKGPRLFHSGKALSQTGGHGDFRKANIGNDICSCACSGSHISRIANGITEVRIAVRDEIRKGATQIKIMGSGGVASPTDRITNLQYSREEIAAIVEEATNAGIYVMAHVYTPEAIRRCTELGVRTIEHGHLIDDDTAKLIAKHNAFLVPTLIVCESLYKTGAANGIDANTLEKLEKVRHAGLIAIKIARENKVKVGFGTDLLGAEAHLLENEEFRLRAQVETPLETIESVTLINAEILNHTGKLGEISDGAYADIIVLNKNPIHDINALVNHEQHLELVMKAGKIYKNKLASESQT